MRIAPGRCAQLVPECHGTAATQQEESGAKPVASFPLSRERVGAVPAFFASMTRRQAVLADVTSAREEARLRCDSLSLEGRQRLYDLEAALDAIENRLLAGREIITEEVLQQAKELSRSLLELVRQRAA